FAVDDKAAGVPKGADIQNAVEVDCIRDASSIPDPKPCLTPEPRPTIKGLVKSGQSVDMNPHATGDEYATLVATSGVFAADLPSATLPEGIRGEHLKITGGDDEANGQVRLVLGSYLENVTVTGGGGSDTFKLKFGDQKTGALAFGAGTATVQTALEGLSNIGVGMVVVTKNGDTYTIELRGKLYLSYGTQFQATDLTGAETTSRAIDDSSVKVNSAWSVEPAPNKATFEVALFSDVHVPNVKVRIFSHAHSAVVVDDGVVRGFHKSDLVGTAPGYMDYVSTVSIADDNWYGVRVVESNGGTSVIEYKDGDDGLEQTQAYSDKFPFQDSYQVSLSKQPAPNQTIRVTVQAQPTRTSETGGIVSFSQQLEVCLDSGCKTAADSSFAATQQVSFDSNNWN